MGEIDIGKWLKEVVFEKREQSSEKIVETVREFLEDSIKLRYLPKAILDHFQPEEFPRLAEILVEALKALDSYRVEIPTLIEKFREIGTIRARRFAVFIRRCPA